MAWSNPRYCFLHEGRKAVVEGNGSWEVGNQSRIASGHQDNLSDDRAESFVQYNAVSAYRYVTLDRGTAHTREPLDRMIVPAGHNFNVAGNVRVFTSDDVGITINVKKHLDTAGPWPDTDLIDVDLTAQFGWPDVERERQFVTLDWWDGGVVTFGAEFSQLVYSVTHSTTRGPVQSWRDDFIDNTQQTQLRTGAIAALELGPDARRIEYEYRQLDPTDELVLANLWEACKTARPFYLYPAYETVPLWVRLQEAIERSNDHPQPAAIADPLWRRQLRMLEHVA